jgi:hypothetical protein
MSDSFSFTEIDGQHVELLPARTVLSMINVRGGGGHCGGDGGRGGDGGNAYGGIGINLLDINLIGDQTNSAANAYGGHGGSANGGKC